MGEVSRRPSAQAMEADGSGWARARVRVLGRKASRMRPRVLCGNLGYGGATPGGEGLEFGTH